MRQARMWPTPVKNEDRAAAYTPETSRRHFLESSHQVHLAQAVRDPIMHPVRVTRFPTPVARDADKRQSKRPPERVRLTGTGLPEADRESGTGAQLSLTQASHIADGMRKFPTPTAQNGLRNGNAPGASGGEHHPMMWQHPGHPEYGELNPRWVEWIMGWPIGWTSLEPMDPAAFEAWFVLTSADPETGFGRWWLHDPSECEDPAHLIPKTVAVASKEEDLVRQSEIAALGNGQVSAVVCAVTVLLAHLELPQGD